MKARRVAILVVAIAATPAWGASPDMSDLPTVLYWLVGITVCVAAFCASVSGKGK